jgi:hypothetical protein
VASSLLFACQATNARNQRREPLQTRKNAYLLTETLVYMAVLFLLLGAGYLAMYRCVDNSATMRRSADDIARALRAGEQWRADVRAAASQGRWETTDAGQVLHLPGSRSEVAYRFSEGAVLRRTGSNPWRPVLTKVKSSKMEADQRQNVTVLRWELELDPGTKPVRVRPLFTFISVPQESSTK